ncbi:CHASE3 domain sensor protein [Amycolatopsis bartoniae]|uniref:histidine kinase n=1 Tax=Amycolatopsis bartoniae TaxID=941986 RepID=A0A8H9IWR3_9PSEU|nr:CHASE3 domain-containing protein [Amycolatopsis bartoniae]MBB2936058.1 CHASE3 domain sensor protein [Amycolatopsis bartoniae]TVT03546.1 HAMP domain-containing protein [Amycolatopsis bartoniae]GHF63828.1 hypothetical protein GCM10017566_41880 [Amycolatopsis bartoniae]
MLTRAWPQTLRWRVYALVGGLLFLLLVTAAATTASRLYDTSVGNHVRGTLRPAQQAAAALSKDYVDMETGVRGFLLTGDDQFLAPFESGQADVSRREANLRQLLAFDAPSLRLLLAVDAARGDWLDASITPSIAAVRSGTSMPNALQGKQAFDVVRARLADLQAHIDELTAAGLQQSTSAQRTANSVTIGCAVFALLIGLVTVLLLRRSLDAPLRRLLTQVRWVADGDLERRVDADGPQEVAEVGRAVESMRVRIIGEVGRASEAADQVVRLEETDRIARELGDTVIKNLFGIGLTLQSAIARYPAAQPVFRRAIADLDQAVNQLRSALYGHLPAPARQSLGLAVQTLVSELEAEVGVVPELVLTGDLDHELPDELVAEVLGVLEEATGALLGPGSAGPVGIELARTEGCVRLWITGPEPGEPEALRALEERARGSGGRVHHEGDRVVIDWEVPV